MSFDLPYAEKLYVYCGWLYENTSDDLSSPMSDNLFDRLSVFLKENYVSTSDWFKNKVSYGMLEAGTASGISLTNKEERLARLFGNSNYEV